MTGALDVKLFLFGAGVSAIPFAVGVVLFPLKENWSALFDSLVSLALCGSAVLMGVRYARNEPDFSTSDGFKIGSIWFGICLAIDLPLFLVGFGMSLEANLGDIAISYLTIPIVVTGLGMVSWQRE